MAQTVARAKSFVQQLDLPAPPPALLGAAGETVDFAFETAKTQAAVVGSDVMAFTQGITPEQRSDLVNATLLAQLAAKKTVPEPQDLSQVLDWYTRYFDVLSNI